MSNEDTAQPACSSRHCRWLRVAISIAQTLALSSMVVAEAAKPDLLASCEPFAPNGEVKLSEGALETGASAHKVETGVLNGVHYNIYYEDSSASFAGQLADEHEPLAWWSRENWEVRCKVDPITDKRSCYLHLGNFWIFQRAKGKSIVSIGADHYPGSTVAVRIDGGTPFTSSAANDGSFPQNTSTRIIQALSKGKQVTTRYMEWPYRAWEDETLDLFGFNEALSYMSWAFDRVGDDAGRPTPNCRAVGPQPESATPRSQASTPALLPPTGPPVDDAEERVTSSADAPAGITATASASPEPPSQISWVATIHNATQSPVTVRGVISFLDVSSAVIAGEDLRTITIQAGATKVVTGVVGVAPGAKVQSVQITLRPR